MCRYISDICSSFIQSMKIVSWNSRESLASQVTSLASSNGMLGLLLITWKNGRPVKTYGVNQVKIYNMKFTFICIVIVMSCSVCASGDLEIYPGLKFNLNTEERRSRLDNFDYPNYYNDYKRYAWQNSPLDDYGEIKPKDVPEYDFMLPDRIQLKEVIDWEKAQLNNRHGNHRTHYEIPRHRFDDFQDIYKQPNKPHNFKNYGLGIPNTQILDDVRMYPQEDDFSFKNDDDDEQQNIPKLYQPSLEEQERMFEENKQFSLDEIRSSGSGDRSTGSSHHEDHDSKLTSEEEFPTGTLRDIKVVDDPAEFAYAPPDPRFYENLEATLKMGEPKKQRLNELDENEIDDNVRVKSRSDYKLRENNQNGMENLHYKSVTGEASSRNGVDVVAVKPNLSDADSAGVYIIAVVAGISAAATVGLIAVGIGWYNLQKHVKNASDVEYPAYGVTGPNKDISPSGDRRLAQSAQMYHYQHQKQQIIAMERAPPGDRHGSVSDADSDEENEEGDYTVYECPGLAPTGEMEVKNPLFQDDPTPAQTTPVKPNDEAK